jgi:tRNA(Ile)-lysidine synthase
MRAAAGSGRDGMAGMSAVVELADVRLLRPLLDVPRARLAATLGEAEQPWIEDPSNRDHRFLRSRAREVAAVSGVTGTAATFGIERAARDSEVAAVLAASAAVYPEGWASVDGKALLACGGDIGRRALAALLLCIGGNEYPPRGERLDRLYAAIVGGELGGGRTLAGCRIVPWRNLVMIVRETAAIGPDVPISGAGRYLWDGRFLLHVFGLKAAPELRLRSLGTAGWSAVAAVHKPLRDLPIPGAVRPSLPAIYDLEGVLAVPHLLYRRQGADPDSVRVVSASFRPRHLLAGAGFAVSPRLRGQIGR